MLYISLAIIETKSISFSTVEEAFDNLLIRENFERDDIIDKAISINDDYEFIIFRTGNRFAFSQFEEGFFGWRLGFYSIGDKSNCLLKTSGLIKGWIRDDYVFETEKVIVNDNEAMILELDKNYRAWVFIDTENELQTDNLNVRFIDKNGNEINTINNF